MKRQYAPAIERPGTASVQTGNLRLKSDRSTASQAGEDALVRLPQAPLTKSPVPWLTSIHATEGRGPYGDSKYRGNCSGLLIRDLLLYYRPVRVLDPMSGGGTCWDVCHALDIPCVSFDLRQGFDATDSACYASLGVCDFVWLHPPYWNMIRYNDHPRCLSNAPTLDAFVDSLRTVLRNCASVLSPAGQVAILMGDGKHQGRYMGLPFRTFSAAAEEGYELAAPEIIRFGHGSTSSQKAYSFSFIPRLHDVCLVLKRCRLTNPTFANADEGRIRTQTSGRQVDDEKEDRR